MTTEELYGEITRRFPARRSKKQKTAFLSFIAEVFAALGYPVKIQERSGSRNLLIGDFASCRAAVTAHYDTPRRNVLNVKMYYDHPRRKALKYLPAEVVSAVCAWARNPNNANDNTSGILGVYDVLSRKPENVCGVLFDNEEKGDLGSSLYYKKIKSMREKLHVNLDCIGVGNDFCVLYNRDCKEAAERLVAAAGGEKRIVAEKDTAAAYYSDNKALDLAVTIAGFKRDKKGLRYNDDIHTAKDTELDLENIDFVSRMIFSYFMSY